MTEPTSPRIDTEPVSVGSWLCALSSVPVADLRVGGQATRVTVDDPRLAAGLAEVDPVAAQLWRHAWVTDPDFHDLDPRFGQIGVGALLVFLTRHTTRIAGLSRRMV